MYQYFIRLHTVYHTCTKYQSTAGAIGGIAASLIRVPTEVIKQRMQTGQFTSASGAVRFIASKEGFKGFYAGYGSFLLRDLPFDAIQFCIYEQIRIGYMLAVNSSSCFTIKILTLLLYPCNNTAPIPIPDASHSSSKS
ncbi:S-adenosylmethionine carrier 1, chloroplastic/mitochondrial-like [Cajanus cajan]|uniref:S-adenosylmethionine carrier 1, chloroplastic/mitochondrial-like n=1 Tax=Cajanus cajan TaxID=3821 RepID=UPI00098D7C5E|nr:S-adenosylmethionine carrier 1, chloroplastic/mitochondrial-like [Cajanus cajan]